jgi:hypothetical protein
MIVSDNAAPTQHLIHVKGLASILEKGITNSGPMSNVGVYSPGAQLVTKGALVRSFLSKFNRPLIIDEPDS